MKSENEDKCVRKYNSFDTKQYLDTFFIDQDRSCKSIYDEYIHNDKKIISCRKISSPISSPLSSLVPSQISFEQINKLFDRKVSRCLSSPRINPQPFEQIDNISNFQRTISCPVHTNTHIQNVRGFALNASNYSLSDDNECVEMVVNKNYLLKKNRSLSCGSVLNFYTQKPKNLRWFYNQRIVLRNEHTK